MNRDLISKIIGLTRHANLLGRLQNELRGDIFDLERSFKEMIQRHWSYIMLHHSLTKDGTTVSWQAIRRWHMGLIGSGNKNNPDYNPYLEKPMKDIAYHFGIELVGSPIIGNKELLKARPPQDAREIFEGGHEVLIGRPLDQEGAHCAAQGMNQKALGICFIGNFDESPVPEAQWQKGIVLVKSLINLLDIPVSFIMGHRDYAPKSCPGKLFDMEKFRQEVAWINT